MRTLKRYNRLVFLEVPNLHRTSMKIGAGRGDPVGLRPGNIVDPLVRSLMVMKKLALCSIPDRDNIGARCCRNVALIKRPAQAIDPIELIWIKKQLERFIN